MNWLVRYWNQNRGKIIITIAIIAFVIIIIQITNSFLKNREKETAQNKNVDPYKPTQSMITGETVSEEVTDKNTEVIDSFIKYCNNKEYEKAFEILSSDCKKIVFNNDINLFKTNYCNHIFATEKTYTLDLWMDTNNLYTYQIKYYEDNLLATGNINMNENIEDYITIIQEDEEKKISINGFITEKTINKSQISNNIEIIINSKKVYKNYETYNIIIKNLSAKTIMISEGQNSKDICLIDSNDVEYPSFLNEISFDSLSLNPGYSKEINIKFNKMYSSYRTIEKMKFSNIILDKEAYENNSDNQAIEMIIEI